MSWEYNLAKEFKKRDNQDVDEPIIGVVVGTNPIQISVYGGSVILNNTNSYISSSLVTLTGTGIYNDTNITCTIDRNLKNGDKVFCIPFNGGQKYFVADKVVS